MIISLAIISKLPAWLLDLHKHTIHIEILALFLKGNVYHIL